MSGILGGGSMGMGGPGGMPGMADASRQQLDLIEELDRRERQYQSTLERTLKLRQEIARTGGGASGGASGGGGGSEASKAESKAEKEAEKERERAKQDEREKSEGFGKAVGSAMSAATGALAVFTQGAQFLGKAFDALSNSSLSASQKFRAVAEEIPVIGGAIKAMNGLSDAALGVSEQFRAAAIRTQMDAAGSPVRGQVERQLLGVGIERAGASGLAAAMRGLPGQGAIGADRSSLAGERQYERERMLRPLELQRDIAAAHVAGSRDAARQAEMERSRAEHGFKQANSWRGHVEDRVGQAMLGKYTTAGQAWGAAAIATLGGPLVTTDPTRGAIAEERANLSAADSRVAEAQKTLADATAKARERGVSLAEKESALRKANISLAQAELNLAEQKEQRLKGQLQTMGMMSQGDQMAAVHAIRTVEELGWEQSGEWARSMAMKVNPERAAQMARRSAEQSGILDQLPDGWRQAGGTVAGVERDVVDREARVRELMREDEQRVTADVSKIMDTFADRIVNAISGSVRAAEIRMENQLRARANMGG